ncbi:hypothetical protein H5410_020191 [Solanum commersonii]|uniref:Uncharacterized protein n=1 Tax=Solanum commersonii TaxID=4109 RepID=A0A9J5ZDF9_SOLCO|nr:hypothetical protein H5410_020191 [Solanum commersonii]
MSSVEGGGGEKFNRDFPADSHQQSMYDDLIVISLRVIQSLLQCREAFPQMWGRNLLLDPVLGPFLPGD